MMTRLRMRSEGRLKLLSVELRARSVPFKLPICKEEDTLRRDLEVRTLYSYKPRYPSFAKPISGTTSTTIRPAEDSISSKSKNEEKLTEEVKAEENPQDESLDISTPKRKSVINNAGMAKAYTSGGTVESNPISGEEQSTNENGRVLKKIPETENFNSIMDIESLITEKLADVYYHAGKNDIQADERVKETIEAKEQKPFKVYVVEMEFPYTKAIPYDPEKLEIAKIGSEFPYSKAIPFDSKKLQVAGQGTEFPYTKAIPFNPEKLYVPKRGIEFPYDKAISYDQRNLKVAKQGSEFPYHMAIPYDSRNLHVPGRGLEFPHAEAIPYDPSILKMAESEYNFVYHKATPYDSEKMYVYTR
ncbi:uncharacterized protein LOC107263504 isoform X2 [Cephus cinctus]|uniref:Uncharacterized protein LOC107263504 isoform X2 n=1 Tax=Cephus cinctus TaxID=211228 RepID=A0AAJ7R948_CEPCN|nr:uncharacterized protein LOC107263504 isoform X2 [Cephus cinctus]